jgi:membrane associated rhomboid family serine protease
VIRRFAPILLLTAVCWLVFLVNHLIFQGHFDQYGITPRQIGSLTGIIYAPFLHASYEHLAANTLPLLILGAIICGRSRGEFTVVTVLGIMVTGGLTWLFARRACHIGASGLVFCYFGYLTSLAYFRRTFGTLCLSVVCLLAYGGMIRGIVPTGTRISWENHLAGLLTGIVLAWVMAKLKRTAVGTTEFVPDKLTQR